MCTKHKNTDNPFIYFQCDNMTFDLSVSLYLLKFHFKPIGV